MSETSVEAVVRVGPQDEIAEWDDAAQQLLGWTPDEVVRRHAAAVLSCPDALVSWLRRHAAAHDASLTTWVATRSGDPVSVSLTARPEGTGMLRLIIARTPAYDDLDARRLAAIVESSDDAIVSKDLDGHIQSWNAAAERIFGYSAEEVLHQSIRVIVPEGKHAEEDQTLETIRRGQRVETFQTIRRRKDGSFIDISLTISPVRGPDGQVIGASAMARDITSHKALDRERIRLLEETAAMMGTLNRVGAAVASDLDRTSMMQAVTDAATELTTARCGVFIDRARLGDTTDLASLLTAPERSDGMVVAGPCPVPATPRLLATTFGGSVIRVADVREDPRFWPEETPTAVADGPELLSYLAVPVKARSGEVVGGLFFGHPKVGRFTDHHERLAIGIASWASVALENARLYEAAQEASRLKDDFLASLSHELRTPLNAILGYTRIVRSGMLPPERHERAMETIERNTLSLAQIVEDVLDVSRIISGKLRLRLRPVELGSVVRAAVDVVMPTADAKGITVDVALPADPLPVSGDPDRLQQVLWNILSNAVKFTPRGGRVSVRVARNDTQVEIVVQDTGIGIPQGFMPHLFERFRQMETGTTRERGGLGLGLAIARQLAEGHGGTIEVESPGTDLGSTFRLRLPVQSERPPVDSVAPEASGAPRVDALLGLHVLAVDDDPDALSLVAAVLEAAGARVTTTSSAAQAIASVEAEVPQVIVADIGMPLMDGYQLMAQLRSHSDARVRELPAAAVTAYARPDDRRRALAAGFHVHMAKPIEPAALVATVAVLAGRANAA